MLLEDHYRAHSSASAPTILQAAWSVAEAVPATTFDTLRSRRAQAGTAPCTLLHHSSTSSSPFPACQAVGDGVQSSRDARHNSAEKSAQATGDGVDKALETPSNAGANVAEARKDGTHGCGRASEECCDVSPQSSAEPGNLSVCLLIIFKR